MRDIESPSQDTLKIILSPMQGSCAELIWTTCFHDLMDEWAQGFLKLNLHMAFFK